MGKWNRSLGTSKREQGIVTPKMPTFIKLDEAMARILIYRFMSRSWDSLSETVKRKCNYSQMTKSQKLEARLFNKHV